jgi:hypothetical protein
MQVGKATGTSHRAAGSKALINTCPRAMWSMIYVQRWTGNDKPFKPQGLSPPFANVISLCPPAFALPARLAPDVVHPLSAPDRLDSLESTGAVMLHEFSHAVLGTNREGREIYGAAACLKAAANGLVDRVFNNAHTFIVFVMASVLTRNGVR